MDDGVNPPAPRAGHRVEILPGSRSSHRHGRYRPSSTSGSRRAPSQPVLQSRQASIVSPNSRPTLIGSPEHIGGPAALACLGHLGPAVDGDADQLLARRAGRPKSRWVKIANWVPTDCPEIADNVGEGLEPVDIVAPHVAVRMAEMIEPPVGPVMPEVTRTPVRRGQAPIARVRRRTTGASQLGLMNWW